MKRDDFLFEIRTEEIPAATLAGARRDLARGIGEALEQEGIAAESVESYGTPRRLVVWARGIPERQSDSESEVLGPPASAAFGGDGKPTRAAEGFARAQKVDVSELEVVDSARGRTVAVRRRVPGRDAIDVLAKAVPRVIGELTFPKTMRWGTGERSFVRPVRGLLAHFIAVMDNADDRHGFIGKGNEWVLNARLADARFFFQEDSREPLAARLPELERLSFQDRLGSYAAKTIRLEELAAAIATAVGRADVVGQARTAARLSKADLVTRMVREFTDLQGVMGGLYARAEGLPEPVWKAISDQYRPQGQGDDPPREDVGAVLSLADRFDTLAGIFRLGLVPTGSKDPYGLRRAAAGAVAIALSRRWRVDWSGLLERAISLYPADLPGLSPPVALAELEKFFAERLRNALERAGSSYDEISAVVNVGSWDFADAAERAAALTEARRRLDFRGLVLAFKRIRNILGAEDPGQPSARFYREDAERALAADFLQAKALLEELVPARRYSEALETIASISPSLDRFFVEVLVNCPDGDLKRNRQALLGAIRKEFTRIADFSEIVVEK